MNARSATRYFALDAIQPGDAILSAARTPASLAIRLATASPAASHVAIALHPLIWFEAIGQGLRFNVHVPELVWSEDRLRLCLPIPPGARFSIKRPKAKPSGQGSLAEQAHAAQKLIRISSGMAFLDYAKPAAFLPLLLLGLGDTGSAKRLAQSLEQQQGDAFAGPFCSWLVAGCYEAMGHNLFDREPHRISPAAIARSRRFDEIPAVVRGRPVDVRPAFAEPTNRLKHTVHATLSILAATDNGARFSKGVFAFNARFQRRLEGFWRQIGRQLPGEHKATLDDLGDRQKSDFAKSQGKLIAVLERGYSNISTHSESVPHLAKCRVRCAREESGSWPCDADNGCSMAGAAFFSVYEQLNDIFPPPSVDGLSFPIRP